jgi:hypothetical protein
VINTESFTKPFIDFTIGKVVVSVRSWRAREVERVVL